MCLTPALFAMFLNILGPDKVTTEPGLVTVHAEVGDALWRPRGAHWCTDAPQIESARRNGG